MCKYIVEKNMTKKSEKKESKGMIKEIPHKSKH